MRFHALKAKKVAEGTDDVARRQNSQSWSSKAPLSSWSMIGQMSSTMSIAQKLLKRSRKNEKQKQKHEKNAQTGH